MSQVIVFDVNGTLLDLQGLAPEIQQIFGDAISVRGWFVEVLQHSQTMTLAGDFAEMGEIAIAVLKMTASGMGLTLDNEASEAVKQRLTSLPPFPDIIPALAALRSAGFRLATLTNSSTQALASQLAHARLTEYFEQTLSVDRVRRYKPAPETYRSACEALHIEPSDLLMVAAHGWDVYGAMRAGCRGAFISRPNQAVFPLGPQPDYFARDLTDLAQQLIGTR